MLQVKIFKLSTTDETALSELNDFLSKRRIFRKKYKISNDGATVTFVIEYDSQAVQSSGRSHNRHIKFNAHEYLTSTERAVYERLCERRSVHTKELGENAYMGGTNRELAQVVRRRCLTLADVQKIEGIGKAKAEKYFVAYLEILAEMIPNLPEITLEGEVPGSDSPPDANKGGVER